MALVLALSMGLVVASPAYAAASQTCKAFKGTLTMSPGLGATVQDQKITIKGTESGCGPTAKTGGTTGSFLSVLTLKKASCATLAKGGTKFAGSATTTWKNKKTSKYSVTYTDGSGSTVTTVTMTGKVASGLFAGKKFTAGFVLTPQGSPDCAKVPFKSATLKQSKAWVIS